MSAAPANSDGWVEWHGGENPVPGQRILVRFGDGEITEENDSESFDWSVPFIPGVPACDVRAYRVVSPHSGEVHHDPKAEAMLLVGALDRAIGFNAYSAADPLAIRLEFETEEDRLAAANAIDAALSALARVEAGSLCSSAEVADSHRSAEGAVVGLLDQISGLCTAFNDQINDADDTLGQINQLAYAGIAALRPDTVRTGIGDLAVIDLQTIRMWLEGLADCTDMNEVCADGGITVGMAYQQDAREFSARIARMLPAISTQGQAAPLDDRTAGDEPKASEPNTADDLTGREGA